jgi:hypothetical protein
MSEPTTDLIDELRRREIREAQCMTPETKLIMGARLFDHACEIAKAGIRHQHPDADEARVLEILRDRIALQRKLERGRDE